MGRSVSRSASSGRFVSALQTDVRPGQTTRERVGAGTSNTRICEPEGTQSGSPLGLALRRASAHLRSSSETGNSGMIPATSPAG